jgi:DNA-binding response OmpR family regulator
MPHQPRTILIVEDEKSLRDALRDKFTREGFTVLEATNGEDGLAVAVHSRPALILLDIVMPRMDGITMLKMLRKDAWGIGAKVIFLTNLSEFTKVSEAMEQGSFNFLVKSDWKIKDVVVKARSLLGE